MISKLLNFPSCLSFHFVNTLNKENWRCYAMAQASVFAVNCFHLVQQHYWYVSIAVDNFCRWCTVHIMVVKFGVPRFTITVQILCTGTDRSQQTVQTRIRLLLKKQSDQGLRCLPFHQHLLDALMQCYIKLFYF